MNRFHGVVAGLALAVLVGAAAPFQVPGLTSSGPITAPSATITTLTGTLTGTASLDLPLTGGTLTGPLSVGSGPGFSLSTAGGINLGIGTAGTSPVTIQAANNNNIVLSTGGQVIVGGQYSPLVSGYYENTESTYTQSGTAPTPLLDLGGQFTGAFGSGGYAPYYALGTTSDTADASGMSQGAMVLFVNGNWGGAGFKGSRSGIYVQQTQQAATTDPSTAIAGISTNEFASYNMGGTGTSVGNGGGAIYGGVLKATAEGTATNLYRVLGAEVDFGMSGSSTASKQGALSLVLLSDSTNTAALQNSFLNLAAQPPTGATNTIPAITNGIAFGEYDGQWAFGTGSTLIGTIAQTVANPGGAPTLAMDANYGIDLRAVTFTTAAFASTGFTVEGAGNVTAASYKVGSAAGVSCPAGTVSLTTLTITNGIVTHC